MYYFNKKDLEIRRKGLRRNMPQPEVLLWSKLRNRQLSELKFKRQYGVGNYIVDFYCPKLRLAIEIDGDSHFVNAAKEYDQQRELFLKSLNIRTIRFTNEEVMKNINGIIERITESIENTSSNSS